MDKKHSPREFYQEHYPELFSDSKAFKKAELDQTFFDYFLSTLTNRSQEKDFEYFCRALAEVEICPNLIVQTGPTGGGDSKVDSETYPVADDLALTWYTGLGREAASERWAFAFSTKKDWRSKVKSDVKSILSTNRDYSKIFFISSQYIPDKKRAEVEDELSHDSSKGVRIFDKLWIIDKVFKNGHKEIAIEYLHLSNKFKDEVQTGPLDYKREQRMKELSQSIQTEISTGNQPLAVEPATEAAKLSRCLELPFSETDGLFNRALTLAEKYGTVKQVRDCLYEWAWTLYWWHEDFNGFYQKYIAFENMVTDSPSLQDLEHLSNLLVNLFSLAKNNGKGEYNLQQHADQLKTCYLNVTANGSKPNATLQARLTYIPIRLLLGENIENVISELLKILKNSTNSLILDFQLLERMVTELPIFQQASNYNELFEALINLSETRKRELETARLLVIRARQLEEVKPYSAIKYYGRALVKLIKEESKKDLTNVLFRMGLAFDRVDLKWAAHGYYLNCFQIGMQHYFDYGEIYPSLLGSLNRLKNFEMLSGRIISAAEFHGLEQISIGIYLTLFPESDLKNIIKKQNIDFFDESLGIQILRTNFDELQFLEYLPSYLNQKGLIYSSTALKYMLGHVDDTLHKAFNNDADIDQCINNWYNQPIRNEMVIAPWYGLGSSYTIISKIMGCTITFLADNIFPCIELAESIAAALEAFLGTGIADNLYSITPTIGISVVQNSKKSFTIESKENMGQYGFIVFCEPYPENATAEYQMKIKEFILEIVIQVIPRIIYFDDTRKALESMMKNDNVLDRSVTFTNSIHIISNYFNGKTPSVDSIDSVVSRNSKCDFIRKKPVVFKDEMSASQVIKNVDKVEKVPLSSQKEFSSLEDVRQSEITVVPTINISLWDAARWEGVAVLFDGSTHLSLSPIFSNIEAGKEIFKEWMAKVGTTDNNNYIKIGIIKGINNKFPSYYRVAFSANGRLAMDAGNRIILTPCRSHTMEAKNDNNVRLFTEMFQKLGEFYIFPSEYSNGKLYTHSKFAIKKKSVDICDAWTISETSFLSSAIFPFDKPLIPVNVKEAPVMKIINRKNSI